MDSYFHVEKKRFWEQNYIKLFDIFKKIYLFSELSIYLHTYGHMKYFQKTIQPIVILGRLSDQL